MRAHAGDTIPLNGEQWPVLAFGDEMMTVGQFIMLKVEAYSIRENWIYGTSVATHTCVLTHASNMISIRENSRILVRI